MTETAIQSESRSEVVPAANPDGSAEGKAATPTAAAADQGVKSDPNVTANGERLDRQTRNWRALETDRDHWRDLALRSLQQREQASPPAQVTPAKADDKPKTLADFDYDEGRYSVYLREQTSRDAVEAARKELQAEREREATERRRASFTTREAEFAKTVEDYYEVTRNPALPVTEDVVRALEDSEDAPALLFHLGKNLDVAARIAQLSPLAAARELGRIEQRLAHEREKAKEEARRQPQAPPPPPKIEGADPAIDPDPDRLSMKEWMKWEDKRQAKKAKERGKQ